MHDAELTTCATRRSNCCFYALHMAYAAGANASVMAVTSAAAAPVAVVCSSSAPLAIAASDLGATSTGSVNTSWAGLDAGLGQGHALAGLAIPPLSTAGASSGSLEPAVGGNPGNANIAALYDTGGGSVSAFVAEVTVDAAFQVLARWLSAFCLSMPAWQE